MKLYFATSSLNINGIISSGNISPKILSEKRNFGTNRFFADLLDINNNYITLYKTIPSLDSDKYKKSNMEQYPVVFELEIEKNDLNLLKINNNIFLYSKSIYLNDENFSVFVSDISIGNILKNKALLVDEVKFIDLLCNHLKVKPNTKPEKISEIIKDDIKVIENPYVEIELINDSVIDTLKGMFIGVIAKQKIYNENDDKLYHLYERNKYDCEFIQNNNFDKTILDTYNKTRDDLIKKLIKTKKVDNFIKIIEINKIELESKTKKIQNFTKEDVAIYELIINSILKLNISGKKLEIQHYKKLIIEIGNQIKENPYSSQLYRDDLRIIYNRIVNNDLNCSAKMLKSNMLMSLFVALIKYNKWIEFSLLADDLKLNQFTSHSFWGALNGFSNMSKSISKSLTTDKLNNIKVFEVFNFYTQKVHEVNCSALYYKRKLIISLCTLKKAKVLENIIKNATNKNINITTKKLDSKLVVTIIESNLTFEIILYEEKQSQEYLQFKDNLVNMGIKKNASSDKFSWFSYSLILGNSKRILTVQEEKILYNFFTQVFIDTHG